jgi:hypothetical protein
MTPTLQTIVSVLGLLGIGGILASYAQMLWERRKASDTQRQEFKFARYKCTVVLMYAYLHFDTDQHKINEAGHRNFRSKNELLNEIDLEWHNALLFGSDEVILALRSFLINADRHTFTQAVVAMRRDLWGKRTSRISDTTLENVDLLPKSDDVTSLLAGRA